MSAISQPIGIVPQILEAFEDLNRKRYVVIDIEVQVGSDPPPQAYQLNRRAPFFRSYCFELREFFEDQVYALASSGERGTLNIEVSMQGVLFLEREQKRSALSKKIEMHVKTTFTEENLLRHFFSVSRSTPSVSGEEKKSPWSIYYRRDHEPFDSVLDLRLAFEEPPEVKK